MPKPTREDKARFLELAREKKADLKYLTMSRGKLLKTILKRPLKQILNYNPEFKALCEAKYGNMVDNITIFEALSMSVIMNTVATGNFKGYEVIMNNAFGKPKEEETDFEPEEIPEYKDPIEIIQTMQPKELEQMGQFITNLLQQQKVLIDGN